MKELSNGQLRMTFCKVCGFKECNQISRLFCLHLKPLDKLAIIADKVYEVVGASSTICAATTVPPPSQSSSCTVFSQPWNLSARADPKAVSTSCCELTRERKFLSPSTI
ncbi:hypothetical protein TNCV_5101441 [Trichonephila clavipes]|nr:hypothetical protein TNCV_5101441 [Trichonephila clavipes]